MRRPEFFFVIHVGDISAVRVLHDEACVIVVLERPRRREAAGGRATRTFWVRGIEKLNDVQKATGCSRATVAKVAKRASAGVAVIEH